VHSEAPRGPTCGLSSRLIAALTRGAKLAGAEGKCKRVTSGPVPCSGARRRGMALDEVSAAIPGDEVAGNQ